VQALAKLVSHAAFQHLGGNAFFEFRHRSNAVAAVVAVDHRVIGETFLKVEVVFPHLAHFNSIFTAAPILERWGGSIVRTSRPNMAPQTSAHVVRSWWWLRIYHVRNALGSDEFA
jgi:hypothetical protein